MGDATNPPTLSAAMNADTATSLPGANAPRPGVHVNFFTFGAPTRRAAPPLLSSAPRMHPLADTGFVSSEPSDVATRFTLPPTGNTPRKDPVHVIIEGPPPATPVLSPNAEREPEALSRQTEPEALSRWTLDGDDDNSILDEFLVDEHDKDPGSIGKSTDVEVVFSSSECEDEDEDDDGSDNRGEQMDLASVPEAPPPSMLQTMRQQVDSVVCDRVRAEQRTNRLGAFGSRDDDEEDNVCVVSSDDEQDYGCGFGRPVEEGGAAPLADPPVSHVMCINIPRSVFPEDRTRTLEQLVKSKTGVYYFKLAALLGNVCFQQSLPEDARDSARGQGKKRRSAPSSNATRHRASNVPRTESASSPGTVRTELDAITAIFRRGMMGGNGAPESERRGIAEEDGRATSPGCFWYSDPNGGREAEFTHTSHFIEGVRSKSGTLLWLRLFFVVHNPDMSFCDMLEQTLHDNLEGKQRESRRAGRASARTAFDHDGDFRVYRKVASAHEYGKLVERYTKVPRIAQMCRHSISNLPPTLVFDARRRHNLVCGVSMVDQTMADPRFLDMERYFDESGKFVLRPDGCDVISKDSSSMNPSNFARIMLPVDIVPGYRHQQEEASPEDAELDHAIQDALEKLRVSSDDAARSDALGELIKIRETCTSAGSGSGDTMMSAYDYDKGDTHGWDVNTESTEMEITNKAIRHRAVNHAERNAIKAQFSRGTPEYVAAMREFKRNAQARMVQDILRIPKEESQWDDAFVLVYRWLEQAMKEPQRFWPVDNCVAKNIGIYGNAMLKDIQAFIYAFHLEPGWKTREMQKYGVVNLNVYDYRFDIHMNNILSGGPSMGKSKLLRDLITCRIPNTIIQTTSMTEKSLATESSRFFNHKTLVFEEAPAWLIGMDTEGKTLKMQSSVLKDVLDRSASLSLRNHWDSEEGTSKISVSYCVLMINVLAATNSGYPSKAAPLMRRMLVDDVVYERLNNYGVRDIAWVLDHQKDLDLKETVQHEQKVRQAMHVLVELFIMSMAIDDVNLDVPILLMPYVFDYLSEHYGIPLPDVRMMGMILKACRVEAIQQAIRVAYFSEIGQLKHQFVIKGDDGQEDGGNAAAPRQLVMNADGTPKKRALDISTIPAEVEPLLYSKEDEFAYVMMMLKSHLVPSVVGLVKNSISKMVMEIQPPYRKLPMLKRGGRWYNTYDPNYYEIKYSNREKFYSDIVATTLDRINETTVQTVISEICHKPLQTVRLSPVMCLADTEDGGDEGGGGDRGDEFRRVEVIDAEMEARRRNPRGGGRMMTVTAVKFEHPKDRNGVVVCIARCLVEHDIPASVPLVSESTGRVVRGAPRIVAYENAMKEALEHAMSHFSTRPRRIVVSNDLVVSGKPYPEMLAYIDVCRNPKRVIMRRHHLAPRAGRELFLGYTSRTNTQTKGFSAPVQIADDDIELVVARNHARNIGSEFNPIVLPKYQEMVVQQIREELPAVFDNITIEYPDEMKLLMDREDVTAQMLMNTVSEAAAHGNLDELIKNPLYQQYSLSKAGELEEEEEEEEEDGRGSARKELMNSVDDDDLIADVIVEEEEYMRGQMTHRDSGSRVDRAVDALLRGKADASEKWTADEMDEIHRKAREAILRREKTLGELRKRKPYGNRTLPSSCLSSDESETDFDTLMVCPDVQREERATAEAARAAVPRVSALSETPPRRANSKKKSMLSRLQHVRRIRRGVEERRVFSAPASPRLQSPVLVDSCSMPAASDGFTLTGSGSSNNMFARKTFAQTIRGSILSEDDTQMPEGEDEEEPMTEHISTPFGMFSTTAS